MTGFPFSSRKTNRSKSPGRTSSTLRSVDAQVDPVVDPGERGPLRVRVGRHERQAPFHVPCRKDEPGPEVASEQDFLERLHSEEMGLVGQRGEADDLPGRRLRIRERSDEVGDPHLPEGHGRARRHGPLPRKPGLLLRGEHGHVFVGIRHHVAEGEVETAILREIVDRAVGENGAGRPVRHPDDAPSLRGETRVHRQVEVREVFERSLEPQPFGPRVRAPAEEIRHEEIRLPRGRLPAIPAVFRNLRVDRNRERPVRREMPAHDLQEGRVALGRVPDAPGQVDSRHPRRGTANRRAQGVPQRARHLFRVALERRIEIPASGDLEVGRARQRARIRTLDRREGDALPLGASRHRGEEE